MLRVCIGCRRPFQGRGARCAPCASSRQRVYDAGRPTGTRAFYGSAPWKKLSADVRASATRCFWCGKQTARLVADHVEPLRLRPDLALEPSNVRPSCIGCNTRRGRNLAPSWEQRSLQLGRPVR